MMRVFFIKVESFAKVAFISKRFMSFILFF